MIASSFPATNSAAGPTQLILEPVDSETAKPADNKLILGRVKGTIGGIAIDPLGHFAIYSERQPGHSGALFLLNLDSKGRPHGAPKVLLKNAFPAGIDILRDRS